MASHPFRVSYVLKFRETCVWPIRLPIVVAVMQLLFEQRAAGELHWLLLCAITLLGRYRWGCIFAYSHVVVVVFALAFLMLVLSLSLLPLLFLLLLTLVLVLLLLLLLYCFSNLGFSCLHPGPGDYLVHCFVRRICCTMYEFFASLIDTLSQPGCVFAHRCVSSQL